MWRNRMSASIGELALERRRGTGGSRIEITLKAVPEGTGLTFVHSRLHDEETRRSHEAGWTGSLDKLEAHCRGNRRVIFSARGVQHLTVNRSS
jgi:uncharacterized protein YndB with AHSA1/START domain